MFLLATAYPDGAVPRHQSVLRFLLAPMSNKESGVQIVIPWKVFGALVGASFLAAFGGHWAGGATDQKAQAQDSRVPALFDKLNVLNSKIDSVGNSVAVLVARDSDRSKQLDDISSRLRGVELDAARRDSLAETPAQKP